MEPKPGVQTSEFKLILVVAVVTVLNGTEWVNIPWDEFLVIFGGLTGLYTGGRTYIKGVAAKAIVQAAVDGK